MDAEQQLKLAEEQSERLEHAILAIRARYSDSPKQADQLVAPYLAMLESVRSDVRASLGISPFVGADLVLRVESPDIDAAGAPSRLLVDTLNNFRSALAMTFASLSRPTEPVRGRYAQDVKRASDVTVLGLAPGSLRIGVDLPKVFHTQTLERYLPPSERPREGPPAQEAINSLIKAARWAASLEPSEDLEKDIPNPRIRRLVLAQVRKIGPSSKGRVSAIEIEGGASLGYQKVRLTPSSTERAREAAYPGSRTREFEDSGLLRSLSLDLDKNKRFFELRNRPNEAPPIKGDFPDELRGRVLDAIKLERRVRVRGILESSSGPTPTSALHLEDFDFDE